MGTLTGQMHCRDSLLHRMPACSQRSRQFPANRKEVGVVSPLQSLNKGHGGWLSGKEGSQRCHYYSSSQRHRASSLQMHRSCRASASDGSVFQERAAELTEEVRRKATETAQAFSKNASKVLENIRRTTVEFERKNNLRGRAKGAASAAGRRFDEVTDDIRRQASVLDSQYGVSEKAKQAVNVARLQAERIDDQYKLRYKTKNAVKDFQRHWPSYQRRLRAFSQTFVGKALVSVLFFWLLVSGWGLTFLYYSLWLGPLIFPLFLKLAGNNMVRGACPKCGTPFLGIRGRMIICQRCQTVVARQWDNNERGDGGGSDASTRIIDIDPQ